MARKPAAGEVFRFPFLWKREARAGLVTDVQKWLMLDEINTDIVEHSFVWDDRTPLRTFSASFTARLRERLLVLAKTGATSVVNRSQ